jgi:hypothetical protein
VQASERRRPPRCPPYCVCVRVQNALAYISTARPRHSGGVQAYAAASRRSTTTSPALRAARVFVNAQHISTVCPIYWAGCACAAASAGGPPRRPVSQVKKVRAFRNALRIFHGPSDPLLVVWRRSDRRSTTIPVLCARVDSSTFHGLSDLLWWCAQRCSERRRSTTMPLPARCARAQNAQHIYGSVLTITVVCARRRRAVHHDSVLCVRGFRTRSTYGPSETWWQVYARPQRAIRRSTTMPRCVRVCERADSRPVRSMVVWCGVRRSEPKLAAHHDAPCCVRVPGTRSIYGLPIHYGAGVCAS